MSFSLRRIITGYANITPKRAWEHLARRYAWMVLGGPAASAVLLLVALAAWPKGALFQLLFVVNLLIAGMSFIPHTSRGRPSTARLVMLLARKGTAADRITAILSLVAIDAQGTPPSAWPREVLERIAVPPEDTAFLGPSLAFRYSVVRDSNDPEAIANALEGGLASIDKLPPDTQRWFCTKAACFQASFRSQSTLAEAWLESARKVKNTLLSEKDWDGEAVGLIALAKGDAGAARESLTHYLAHVDRQPRPLCGMLVAQRARTLARLNQIR